MPHSRSPLGLLVGFLAVFLTANLTWFVVSAFVAGRLGHVVIASTGGSRAGSGRLEREICTGVQEMQELKHAVSTSKQRVS